MKPLKFLLLCAALLSLSACGLDLNLSEDDAPSNQDAVSFELNDIAANPQPLSTRTPTEAAPAPEPLRLGTQTAPESTSLDENTTDENDVNEATEQPSAALAITPQAQAPAAPEIQPTSHYAEVLQPLQDNTSLALSVVLEDSCFISGQPIPFQLNATNLGGEAIYFYLEGRWLLSFNNSAPGPQVAPRVPSSRAEFISLAPNEVYQRAEEDLGLWVLSLGPQYLRSASATGFGLAAGDYWIAFLYNNDQDGLEQQPDGGYLIDRAAWRGTSLSAEVRFRVVDEQTDC